MPHTAATATDTPNAFIELGLAPQITATLEAQGFNTPTPIQAAAIPEIMAGHDIMASAQTGTGKTAAFLLPALHKLTKEPKHNGRGPRILVLTPTRELAEQVSKVATEFCRKIPRCKVVTVVGGVPYPVQNKMLAQPYEVLVATPGRLTDLMRNGRIDFRRMELLVLDEADRMLDMGFIDEVESIVEQLPKERQTALFSATLSESVQSFAEPMLRSPKLVEMAPQEVSKPQIEQRVHYADGYEHKQKLVAALLRDNDGQQTIIFTATKLSADELAEWLKLEGFKAAAMHGDLAQRDRRRTLDRLRRGDIDTLVATDVAARGIDVAGISLVINFDLPRFAEDYIHRIGRTGRAGRSGVAVSLVTKSDFSLLTKIRRQFQIEFGVQEIEGLEARFQPGRGHQGGDRRGAGGPGRGRGRDGGYNKSFGGYKGQRQREDGQRHTEGHRSEASRGSYGERERQPRGEGFGGQRERQFDNRESRGGYGNRTPRGGEFAGDRAPRGDFDRAPRGDFGGERAPRGNYGGDRGDRGGRDFDRAPRGDFGSERAPRSNFDRAPRGDFGGERAPRGNYGGQREQREGGQREVRAPRGDFGGKPDGKRGGGRFS
ncbi:DEAD/DEAH box helicase [Chitinibacter tainanensis]|uniref:DEAD/DEAH box helicase n=1 Tax=Chitinibacter tainanensis TaxID=230667 RepID=UPI00041EDD1A|nr:DEAD/DEAH box helicase [Chitinibacter tainanensis]